MNKLFLFMILFLTGCADAIRVKSTTPVGKVPYNDKSLDQFENAISHNGMWITVWLVSICVALFFVFKTFKKEN